MGIRISNDWLIYLFINFAAKKCFLCKLWKMHLCQLIGNFDWKFAIISHQNPIDRCWPEISETKKKINFLFLVSASGRFVKCKREIISMYMYLVDSFILFLFNTSIDQTPCSLRGLSIDIFGNWSSIDVLIISV